MDNSIEMLKGVHPGAILERELKIRKISKGRLALAVREYPQTIGSITKGKRNMNTPLALKIEKELGLEEGLLMTLQVFYEIKQERLKQQLRPDLSKIRPAIFWDTTVAKIDWQQQKKAVINRIFERGNEQEKEEIIRFYGKEEVDQVIDQLMPDSRILK
jgi:plasmid maintenance system antidote protein VapI